MEVQGGLELIGRVIAEYCRRLSPAWLQHVGGLRGLSNFSAADPTRE
jgi:hypothetical protein